MFELKKSNNLLENELFKKMNNIGAFDSLSTNSKEQKNIFLAKITIKIIDFQLQISS